MNKRNYETRRKIEKLQEDYHIEIKEMEHRQNPKSPTPTELTNDMWNMLARQNIQIPKGVIEEDIFEYNGQGCENALGLFIDDLYEIGTNNDSLSNAELEFGSEILTLYSDIANYQAITPAMMREKVSMMQEMILDLADERDERLFDSIEEKEEEERDKKDEIEEEKRDVDEEKEAIELANSASEESKQEEYKKEQEQEEYETEEREEEYKSLPSASRPKKQKGIKGKVKEALGMDLDR